MFLRWDRSYVREELLFLRVVWNRPLPARLMALSDRFITNLRYPVHYACLFLLALTMPHHPLALLRLLIVAGAISAFNMLYYIRSERSPDFFYGVVYAYYSLFALFWIFPVAVFTVRSRSLAYALRCRRPAVACKLTPPDALRPPHTLPHRHGRPALSASPLQLNQRQPIMLWGRLTGLFDNTAFCLFY